MSGKKTVFTGKLWCSSAGEVSAVAVEDGRIVALGDDALASAGEQVTVTDGVLTPAFGDGHAHPVFGGLEAEGPQIRQQTSVAGIAAEVARWAREHPDAEWIRGASYDSSLAPEGLFDARWLDEAVPDRPVLLRAWDYHTVWVNSVALERAGITEATADPPLGEITHRPDGSVLGTLREWGAVELVTEVAGPLPEDTYSAAIRRACEHYAALGVTWVQDAWVEPDLLEAYLRAAERDELTIRFNLALYADPRRWPEQLEQLLEAKRRVDELAHPHLTAHTVKFFADGVVENETAAVLHPYCVAHPHDGMLVWPPDQLAGAVAAVDAHGLQPHLHAIGDRAVRVALDAIEHAHATNRTKAALRQRRPVIAHLQLVDEADRDRLAALGVVANAEPLWAQLDALMNVLTVPRLGRSRSDTQYPWQSLVSSGTTLSFGSDWPVSSADPLEGIAVTCSRQTEDREPGAGWTPGERLSVSQAFGSYTAGVAHQAYRNAGTLSVGADADFVLLSADPREVAGPRDLDRLQVLATWVSGRQIFRRS